MLQNGHGHDVDSDIHVPVDLESPGEAQASGLKAEDLILPSHQSHVADSFSDSGIGDQPPVTRTGTWVTAAAHIITSNVGSELLALAWSTSTMGWIAGPAVLFIFAPVTWYTSLLLADAHGSPKDGTRNSTYPTAVRAILGGKYVVFCATIQYAIMVVNNIGHTITAGISMRAVHRSECFHHHPAETVAATAAGHIICQISNNPFMLIFGGIQILLSQIPDIDKLWLLSVVSATMSISYAIICVGLSIGKTTVRNHSYGSIGGTAAGMAVRTWNVLNAFGNIAFAYDSISVVLLEIQDTLKAPPSGSSEKAQMKKAIRSSWVVFTSLYMCVGCLGYSAFGDKTPINLLTKSGTYGFYNPYWLIDCGNIFVMMRMVGAYQIYAQPWFAAVEGLVYRRVRRNWVTHNRIVVKLPGGRSVHFTLFKLVWRTAYVCFTTLIAMLLPFFADVVGLLGALGFWPLTIFLPVQMHIVQAQIPNWKPKWVALQSLSVVCLAISLLAMSGSIAQIVVDCRNYKPFVTQETPT